MPDSPTTSHIAIAIPVYNGAAYLAEAVASALGQSLPPAEISIVDDASTDETPEVISAVAGHALVHAQRLPARLPAPGAWNAAVRSSSASHLVLLAHDDILEPDFCREAQRLIETIPDLDLIAFGHQDINSAGDRQQIHPMRDSGLPTGIVVDGGLFLDYFCASGQFFLPSAVVISRRIFEKVGGFDERLKVAYDWDFYLRVGACRAKIVLCDQVLCRYRLHATQSVQSFTRRDNGDNDVIFEKLAPALSDRQLSLLVDGMCDFMRNMVSKAVRDPDTSAAQVLMEREQITRKLREWRCSALPHAAHVSIAPRQIKRKLAWHLMRFRPGIGLIRRLLGVKRR